jgi:hypothetical protein
MGKRLKNVWEKIIDKENLNKAYKLPKRGKKDKEYILNFERKRVERVNSLHNDLENKKYVVSKYMTEVIYEPKERILYKLPNYPDKVIQRAVINVIEPNIVNWLIPNTYACIKKRGIHKASDKAMEFIARNDFCLKCDIRKFYPSIDHDILFSILCKKIGDPNLLWLLEQIVYSIGGGKNAPIGSLLSQHFGNIYMNEIDRFIVEQRGFNDYERYCDDFLTFSNDKKKLRDLRFRIIDFAGEKLKLDLSKDDIFKYSQGVDFMGYRHFRGYRLLRKSTAKKIKKRVPAVTEKFENGLISQEKFRSVIASTWGWASKANCKNFIEKTGLEHLKELSMVDFSKICDERDKNLRKVKGDKVDIKDWLNKPIKISYFKISKSNKKQGTNCMSVEFYYDGKAYMFFTGSPNLMYLIDKYLTPEMVERGETLDATIVRKDGMLILA